LTRHGPGERKGQRGYKATGRSSATIADAASLSAIGRVDLGFGLESVLTWRSADGRTLALLQGQPRTAKYPFPQSKVTIVDVAGPTVTATLDAGGWDIAERDADRLYLIRRGRPDKNPEKNQNGVVDVVSFAGRTVDRVDIGRAPIGCLLAEGGLMAVASEGPAGGPAGELRVLREGKLVATLPVAARPAYAAFHAGSIYVVGAKAVTAVDPRGPEVTATIPLAKGADAIVDDDDQPFEVAVTSDSRRAFVHYPAQDKVAVLDLEQKKAIGSTKTGRGGKKFLNLMAAGLTQGMYGRIHFYNPGDPPQMLVRPDGRFAYALNLDTGDVTIVDAGTAAAVEKIGTGGGRALFRLGDSTLVVMGPELHVIDTSRNAKIDQLRLPGLRDFALAPDGTSAVALAGRTVLILDGATGRERARLTDLAKPTRVAFAPIASPATP
jgi:DNA-binding beta-propeller fold protein YncE